jgi:hypothetical protein
MRVSFEAFTTGVYSIGNLIGRIKLSYVRGACTSMNGKDLGAGQGRSHHHILLLGMFLGFAVLLGLLGLVPEDQVVLALVLLYVQVHCLLKLLVVHPHQVAFGI